MNESSRTEDPEASGERLSRLRANLGRKAKQEPRYRFYSLYDKVCWKETLEAAWRQVRRNGGAAGVDGVTVTQVERSGGGVEGFLGGLQADLLTRRYAPGPVKRVYIPKANGKMRPLGIPTVRDRVAQAAVRMIVEPIFEADFLDCSYGFRPGRSAHQALREIREHIRAGHSDVYDADLKGYFDSIPHYELMKCVERRISDGRVLKLIRQWLRAPVVTPPEKPGDPPTISRSDRGTPQGGVISPLLANLYLHWFDVSFHRHDGPGVWAKAKLVRYADDFVVMADRIGPPVRDWIEGLLEGRFRLPINREKTRVVDLKQTGAELEFLGYAIRYGQSQYGPGTYVRTTPSKKAMARERQALREMISRRNGYCPIPVLIARVNRQLTGWAHYFSLGQPYRAFQSIYRFVRDRLYRHLRHRSQRRFRPPAGETFSHYVRRMGLMNPTATCTSCAR